MAAEHLNILCVDDDADIRLIVDLALGLDGRISVRSAGSGAEALKLLSEGYHPDCILLDIMMPGGDGRLLLGEIRCLPGFLKTPIIFLTACIGSKSLAEAQDFGANGLIAKPFDPLRLAETVRAQLAGDVAHQQRSA